MVAPNGIQFSTDSLKASLVEPSELLESSLSIGWRSALLRVYRSSGESDAFETGLTDDFKIVVNLQGQSELRSLRSGLWRSGVKGPGSFGITPAGEACRLRWRSLSDQGFMQAHLHIPGLLIEEGLEERRRAGGTVRLAQLNTLAEDDVVVAAVTRELVAGMRAGHGELFAEERVRCLATRLTVAAEDWEDQRERDPGPLSEARLRRALEFMSSDLSIEHGLEEIAREAGISVYHFARMFRAATGRPPHAYLTDLRLDTARSMLERSDIPVAEVARLVGYPVSRNFNAAFARRYGCTPGSWRRDARARGERR